jgi:hypothetical protein
VTDASVRPPLLRFVAEVAIDAFVDRFRELMLTGLRLMVRQTPGRASVGRVCQMGIDRWLLKRVDTWRTLVRRTRAASVAHDFCLVMS